MRAPPAVKPKQVGSTGRCKSGRTFQWRLRVQNSQICMPQVQHCLVAGRRHTSHVTTSWVNGSHCSPDSARLFSSTSSPPAACSMCCQVRADSGAVQSFDLPPRRYLDRGGCAARRSQEALWLARGQAHVQVSPCGRLCSGSAAPSPRCRRPAVSWGLQAWQRHPGPWQTWQLIHQACRGGGPWPAGDRPAQSARLNAATCRPAGGPREA